MATVAVTRHPTRLTCAGSRRLWKQNGPDRDAAIRPMSYYRLRFPTFRTALTRAEGAAFGADGALPVDEG